MPLIKWVSGLLKGWGTGVTVQHPWSIPKLLNHCSNKSHHGSLTAHHWMGYQAASHSPPPLEGGRGKESGRLRDSQSPRDPYLLHTTDVTCGSGRGKVLFKQWIVCGRITTFLWATNCLNDLCLSLLNVKWEKRGKTQSLHHSQIPTQKEEFCKCDLRIKRTGMVRALYHNLLFDYLGVYFHHKLLLKWQLLQHIVLSLFSVAPSVCLHSVDANT